MAAPNVRSYTVHAGSTDVFGRVLVSSRNHHVVVDGPEQNGCPGEALTPPEHFLFGVACCAVELIQVIGRDRGTEPSRVAAEMTGRIDRDNRVREDLMVFNSVTLAISIDGVSEDDGKGLVDGFKARCPLYGSVAASCPDVDVRVTVTPEEAGSR